MQIAFRSKIVSFGCRVLVLNAECRDTVKNTGSKKGHVVSSRFDWRVHSRAKFVAVRKAGFIPR